MVTAIADVYGFTEAEGGGIWDPGNLLANDIPPGGTITHINGIAVGTGRWFELAKGWVYIAPDGRYDFDAAGDFDDLSNGEAESVQFNYTVTDGISSDWAVVTIIVNGIGPRAVDDTFFTGADDGPGTFTSLGVLGNDIALGGLVTAVNGAPSSVETWVQLSAGRVYMQSGGRFDYDAQGLFDDLLIGQTETVSFTYTVTNPDGPDTAAVDIIVRGEKALAVDDHYTNLNVEPAGPGIDGNFLNNDFVSTQQLTHIGTTPLIGSLSINLGDGGLLHALADGSFDFEPDGDFDHLYLGESEQVSFTYTITGGSTATVTIDVLGTQEAPVTNAVMDTIGVSALDGPDSIDGALLSNDSGHQLEVTGIQGGTIGSWFDLSRGRLLVNSDGTFDFDADMDFDHLNHMEIQYVVLDYTLSGLNGTDTGKLRLSVSGFGHPVDAVDDDVTIQLEWSNVSYRSELFANDELGGFYNAEITHLDGNPYTYGTRIDLAKGSIEIDATGRMTFDHDGDFADLMPGQTETVSFTYTLDGRKGTDTATVDLVVKAPTTLARDDILRASYDSAGGDLDPGNLRDNDLGLDVDIIRVNGAFIGTGGYFELAKGGVYVGADGRVDFFHDGDDDGTGDFEHVLPGETDTVSFTYVLSEGSSATVDVIVYHEDPADTRTWGAADVVYFTDGSSDENTNAHLAGVRWADTDTSTPTFEISYSFPDSLDDYEPPDGVHPHLPPSILNADYQAATREWMDKFSAVAGLVFTEFNGPDGSATDPSNAIIKSLNSPDPNTAYAGYPGAGSYAGDIFYGPGFDAVDPIFGSYAHGAAGHELGHATGLKHGHQEITDGSGGVLFPAMTLDRDSSEFSIMTYRSHIGQMREGQDNQFFYKNAADSGSQTPMMYDISALQYLYGANFGQNAGNTIYKFDTTTGEMSVNGVGTGRSSGKIFRTIWDGDGDDTYDFSNFTTNTAIDLTPGGWSDLAVGLLDLRADLGGGSATDTGYDGHARAHVYNALQYQDDARSLIENAWGGSGNDAIKGNAADNHLDGNQGNDTLEGGIGADSIDGDGGIDWVSYAGSADGVVIDLGTGAASGGDAEGDSFAAVENILGSAAADRLTGDGGTNIIIGGEGNDILRGGVGNDTLEGGGGFDFADYRDAPGVLLIDLETPGNSSAFFAADTLIDIRGLFGVSGASNTFVGDGARTFFTGGNVDDYLQGNGGGDILRGKSGNDTLNGGDGRDALLGNAGNDTLTGGMDRDIFWFGIGSDGQDVITDFMVGQDLVGSRARWSSSFRT